MSRSPADRSARVKTLARECGFDLARIGPASDLQVARARYLTWLRDGRHGEMGWMSPEWATRASSPSSTLGDALSVVSVGLAYGNGSRPAVPPGSGRIARYAWGRDYHAVLGERLRTLATALEQEFGGAHRWYVDTGPAMDKALAARSGLGWYGKNTNILSEKFGSWILLGEIITTLALEADAALSRDCGACRLCLVACPTGALGPEYSIDSRRCISYLTIEHRGPIPRALRSLMSDWVFGCDICQDVCPPSMLPFLTSSRERAAWAREVRALLSRDEPGAVRHPSDSAPQPARHGDNPLFSDGVRPSFDLVWLLKLSHDQYLEAFRGTAIRRAKVWMLRRNAAVALGNVGTLAAVLPLLEAARADENAIVRGHAAWALGELAARLGLQSMRGELLTVSRSDTDPGVREEARLALEECSRQSQGPVTRRTPRRSDGE